MPLSTKTITGIPLNLQNKTSGLTVFRNMYELKDNPKGESGKDRILSFTNNDQRETRWGGGGGGGA